MKFKQIKIVDSHGGFAARGIGVLEDGTPVWVQVTEENRPPSGLIRHLDVTELHINDKRPVAEKSASMYDKEVLG